METDQHHREETITPVRLELAPGAPAGSLERAGRRPWTYAAGVTVGLVAVLLAVFFLLPKWVAESETQSAAARGSAPKPAEPETPQLGPAELEALRARAEGLLADLLSQHGRLESQHAEAWGGDQWTRYTDLSRTGDDAYLADSFEAARSAYTQALAVGEGLLGRSVQIVDSALEAARRAFAAGKSELAIEQLDIVLGIDPENDAAKRVRARAERLPDVLGLVQRGDDLRASGDLTGAAAAYREALAIDADWKPARDALESVNGRLESAAFERAMSMGFAALAGEDFREAAEHFRAALDRRPGAREASDGLEQALQGLQLDQIALAEARALAFERRELWNQAIGQYTAALATDDTLAFAIDGLERARARADLDAKLANLIGNPNLLFRDSVLADAAQLLEQARAIDEPGARLRQQAADLSRLVKLAATPVNVELRSDGQTEVTLYRVGKLGAFAEKQVEVRPGTYTAVGSRDGYRDVRATFTVLPGRDVEPVSIVCVEPI